METRETLEETKLYESLENIIKKISEYEKKLGISEANSIMKKYALAKEARKNLFIKTYTEHWIALLKPIEKDLKDRVNTISS